MSGSRRESVLREAFKDLLKRWGRSQELSFVPEHDILTAQKNRIYVDGALLHALRVPFGYWEAKDADDDLDAEIAAKFRKGYPRDNIIFSDDHTAVLVQDGTELVRVAMDDTDALYGLLTHFFGHERREIAEFNKAVKQFAADLPAVLDALRALIADKRKVSREFDKAEKAFLKHAQDAINPAVTRDDVQEMLIQHVLTEDIFAKVFDNPDFHRQNNVASELYKLEDKLFARGEKSTLLRALAPYYSGIAATAAVISTHSEKQGFLKGLYENFYKVYNPKAADKLGVVYTPGEIVRFMIRSTDWLCEKHFGKNLIDQGVEILDPATGTGTFIVELLESFRGHGDKLRHKYKEELHANEIAILPYYVANLNIEATYQAITGQFAEFENLCLVDTLDNVDALGIHAGHQFDLLGSLSDVNIERIKRQNRRKISVIIGNPPYNANQQNENDDNKNRVYSHIDKMIKNTYIKNSIAKKPKSYDMYARFYRWASDRLSDEGIIAFITNRSFIWAKTYDGFRKLLVRDFAEIWVCDLGGDWKQTGDAGGANVFGISTGVAICFLVKKRKLGAERIFYGAQPEKLSKEDKLTAISQKSLADVAQTLIKPDNLGYWIEPGHPDFGQHIPMISEKTKKVKGSRGIDAIFRNFCNGINTARDSWVYGTDPATVASKISFFGEVYRAHKLGEKFDAAIKWSRNLKNKQKSGVTESFCGTVFDTVNYRPFSKRVIYHSNLLIDEPAFNFDFFNGIIPNFGITFPDTSSRAKWTPFCSDKPIDFHFGASSDGHKIVPRYTTALNELNDNITDWGLKKFTARYGKKAVTKDAIFAYCYAVLHDPVYREKYALNLKREFPRIPFYPDFAQWVAWGQALMAMHIGYELVEPWALERIDVPEPKRAPDTHPKPVLKSHPDKGYVVVDADTQLTGIPRQAWDYRLGNRSAIDWVLDQHKEKKPRDPTIAAKFNTYRFADYKESMIDLLARVVRVSVDTVEITGAMQALDRSDWE
ncbi:hypothetical protein GCM10019060_32190 [Novosphingobium pokkalii]|nr:hypothetical protein GCM10019060_32190 [Novosphingobium pokkalii]